MKKKNNGIYILISTIIFCIFGYYIVNNILFHLEKNQNTIKIDDNGIADAVDKIFDATVSVNLIVNGETKGAGSGFVFSKDGYILTNHHVISDNDEFSVVLDGKYISAEFIGSDEYADVAVLKIDPKFVKSVAIIGKSNESRVGDTIFAVGTPVDIKYAGTVTRGIISAKNRLIETKVNSETTDWLLEVIQVDAAINNGNSGGPLCNVNGEVIGVNTMKVSTANVENIAFAIPIESAMEYANKLIKGEKIDRPMLGIRMANAFQSSYLTYFDINIDSSIVSGVVVVEPLDGGPGYNAGLKKGDVIIKINNINIRDIANFNYNLFKYKSGDKINLEIIRNGKNMNVDVVLGEKDK